MRPQKVTLGAVASSAWFPVHTRQLPLNIGFSCKITPSASLTYQVQHTQDDLGRKVSGLTIARVTTTVTVTQTDHGLSVGDWVHVEGANRAAADVFDGDFTVAAITDANNFTYTVANAGATTAASDARIVTARVSNHSVVTAKTANADDSYLVPISAFRLNVSVYSSGKVTLIANAN